MSPTSPTDPGTPTTAPRISVVMPVYNAERLLGECLSAVNVSTFRDYEVVVVDDSSTDRSREIAAANGARVVIIFFIDSDVVVRPDTLGRLVAAFDRDPGVAGLMAVQSPTMRFRNLC